MNFSILHYSKEENFLRTGITVFSCVSWNTRTGIVVHHICTYPAVCTRCWFAIIDILKKHVHRIKVAICDKLTTWTLCIWYIRGFIWTSKFLLKETIHSCVMKKHAETVFFQNIFTPVFLKV